MKSLFAFIFMIAGFAPSLHAQPMMYMGTDLSPMVEFFRSQVVVLDKPITTFNWTSGARDVADWFKDPTNQEPQGSPKMLDLGRHLSQVFWKWYGSRDGASNSYGMGLYSAIDPVTTFSYGMGEGGWRLVQIRYSPGVRMLDFANIVTLESGAAETATLQIEKNFGCPISTYADMYFSSGGANLSKNCSGLIRQVFSEALKVDVMAYDYSGTPFNACAPGNSLGMRAFVALRPDWIKSPDDIHVYTAATSGNIEERIRLQSLFLKSTSDPKPELKALREVMAQHLDQYPDREIRSTKTACSGESCIITATFCDSKNNCDALNSLPIPRPSGGLITAAEANKSQLLWPDLVGKPQSNSVTTWLKQNRFGCSGALPYKVK